MNVDPAVVNDRNNIPVCENLNNNILIPDILNPVHENVNTPGVNNVIIEYADIPAINNPIPEIRNSNEIEEPEPIPVPQNATRSKRSVKNDDCVVIGHDAEAEESLLDDDAPESCETTATLVRPVAAIKPYNIDNAPSSPDSIITVDLSSDEDQEGFNDEPNWSPSFRSIMTYEADPDAGDVTDVVSMPANIMEPPMIPVTACSAEETLDNIEGGFRISRLLESPRGQSPTWSVTTEDSTISSIPDLPSADGDSGASVGDLTNQFPNLCVNPFFQAPATRVIIPQVGQNENQSKTDVKMTYKYASARRVHPYPRVCGPRYLTLNVPLPPFLFSPPPYFPQYRPNKLFKCRVCMAAGKTVNLRHHVDTCPLKDK
ncbi:unnamed protein product [Allacma fusca]|uniref:Uncharacterized protein n=1 Tax=Allacma fusca TaxID=39272 RepID=A0A8J2K1Z3_9HEXA|nr:unnamed protein product [Allacma fusca]